MKRNVLLSIVVLSACIVADRQASSAVLTGTLVGHDGKPMLAAHVHITPLTGSLNPEPLQSVAVDAEGRFEFTNETPGPFLLLFTGVHHQTQKALVLDTVLQTISVDVQLATYDYYDHTDWLGVIGDFNEFAPPTPAHFVRNSDGTYLAEVETIDDTLDFQILGVAKGTIIAGFGDGYTYAYEHRYATGGYRSWIAAPRGSTVAIRYEPGMFPPSGSPSHMAFANPEIDKIARIYQAMNERQWQYFNARSDFVSQGGNYPDFTMDWSETIAELEVRLGQEKDSNARALTLLAYLQLKDLSAPIDSAVARHALEELSPSAPVWTLKPGAMITAAKAAGGIDAHREYLDNAIATHSDSEVVATVLLALVANAHDKEDKPEFDELYGRLVSNYPDSWQAKSALSDFAVNPTIAVGQQVPAFSLHALGDSTEIYSPESLAGTVYLIDIWATWCANCLGEIAGLQEQYTRFRDRGFEILSVSLDRTPGVVTRFREQRESMPWLHAFSPGGFNSDAARVFEVSGVPKPILVDSTGQIVAIGAELRGERLAETLARVLGD